MHIRPVRNYYPNASIHPSLTNSIVRACLNAQAPPGRGCHPVIPLYLSLGSWRICTCLYVSWLRFGKGQGTSLLVVDLIVWQILRSKMGLARPASPRACS